MVRISYDYDLMTLLARHLWHLRDELDVASQTDKTFAAGDVGPRRETAAALEEFYGAWKNSFREGWQVMTDLGDLLDNAGKAFYDQDAALAGSVAQQVASQARSNATRQNQIREQKLNGLRRKELAERLELRYKGHLARLEKEQEPLKEKQRKIDARVEAEQKRQEDLNKQQDELAKKQEPLLKRLEELQRERQQLRQEGGGAAGRIWADLEREWAEVQKRLDPLDQESKDLQARQEELGDDQTRTEAEQQALSREAEPLQQRLQQLQDSFGKQYEDLADYEFDPASGESDPLTYGRGTDEEREVEEAAFVPKDYTIQDDNTITKVSYGLDETGEIKTDKDGNPVETTTTVTNRNTGLSHSETFRPGHREGDSVTTIHSADGSVTKVYVDSAVEGAPDGTMKRWVTDETGRDTLQIWTKPPGGEWVLNMDKQSYLASEASEYNPARRLEYAPAYLVVEKPLVDAGGRPADSATPGHTTTPGNGMTWTAYSGSDGAVATVVTNDVTGMRYVAAANDEVQEIWRRSPHGHWYLSESITQHERSSDEPPLGTIASWR